MDTSEDIRIICGFGVAVRRFASDGADNEALRGLALHPEVSRWLTHRYAHSMNNMQGWNAAGSDGMDYAIEVDGKLAGSIGYRLMPQLHPDRAAEVGFWIGSPYQHKGVASAALRGLMLYLRNRGLLTLWGYPAMGNLHARRTLERAGFRFVESAARDHEPYMLDLSEAKSI
jgi:RimJ/RimL family protein N-acetyltransferase